MTDQEINIAIAEVCGVQTELVTPDGGSICYLAQSKDEIEKWLASLPEGSWAKDYVPKAFYRYPNYSCDLNAMHEAEGILTNEQIEVYCSLLQKPQWGIWWAISATARQRAEAFLRTIGKWKEGAK